MRISEMILFSPVRLSTVTFKRDGRKVERKGGV